MSGKKEDHVNTDIGRDARAGPKWMTWILSSVAMVVIALVLGASLTTKSPDSLKVNQSNADTIKTAVHYLGTKGALLFNSIDDDKNGIISAAEFGSIVEKLTGETPPVLLEQQAKNKQSAPIKLYTEYEQVRFESMKTYEDEGINGMMRNFVNMKGLRDWTSPAQTEAIFNSLDFHAFLPKIGDDRVGKSYFVFKPVVEPWSKLASSARYYPPTPVGSEAILYRLLKMFHSRPFIVMRFGPQGTAAVVQAVNERFFRIRIRIHAEFQLNEPPQLPFWYTPAQFVGDLIITKDGLQVQHFELHLPADRLLNVDLEWITALENADTGEGERMEVEIAHQSKMNLLSLDSSKETYSWTEEITESEADELLEKAFFPFKQVKYFPFNETFRRAAMEEKLIHTIVLWGSLDDQSC